MLQCKIFTAVTARSRRSLSKYIVHLRDPRIFAPRLRLTSSNLIASKGFPVHIDGGFDAVHVVFIIIAYRVGPEYVERQQKTRTGGRAPPLAKRSFFHRELSSIVSSPNMEARTASNLAFSSSLLVASCSHKGFLAASLAMRSASETSSDSFRFSSLKSIFRTRRHGDEQESAEAKYCCRHRCACADNEQALLRQGQEAASSGSEDVSRLGSRTGHSCRRG